MPELNPIHSVFSDSSAFKEPSTLVDSEQRIKYNSSIWYSIFPGQEKLLLNNKLWENISQFFQERYKIDDPQHFLRIWGEIVKKEWTFKSPLTVGHLKTIDHAFKTHLAYHGSGINLKIRHQDPNPSPTQQLVNILVHGDVPSRDLLQKPLIKAILVKKDPEWLQEFRTELQKELENLINEPPKNSSEEIAWRHFFGNIIAFLPFAYPNENEEFNIPYLDEERNCHLILYRAHVIELTPPQLSTPISAVGFTPIKEEKGSPILSYLGTTYPAGNGFAVAIQSDSTPGKPVGKDVFEQGKEKIAQWLNGKENVHVIGTSLGGAIAFHTLLEFENKLSRVDVYNPPGLYKESWQNHIFNEGCCINIYCQSGDIVPKMGFWPIGKNVRLFNIIPHQEGVMEKMPLSHMQIYSGCNKVTFLECDPSLENKKISRRALVLLHRFLGPIIFYYPTRLILCFYRLFLAYKRSSQKRITYK